MLPRKVDIKPSGIVSISVTTVAAAPDTVILRPVSNGDIQLSPHPDDNLLNYDCVDDESSEEDETCVFTSSQQQWQEDLYNLTQVSSAGKINSVTVYIRCRKDRGSGDARTVIKTYDTIFRGTSQNLIKEYRDYFTVYLNNPRTGSQWTWEEINTLQAGVGLSASNKAKCTQVWVKVDYSPPHTH